MTEQPDGVVYQKCHAGGCVREATHAGPSETANPDTQPRLTCEKHAEEMDERL